MATPMEYGKTVCKAGVNDGQEHETVDVPYRQAIVSLLYLAGCTRPDIAYATNL